MFYVGKQSQIHDFRRSRVIICRKSWNPPILTFLSIKSPIFVAQKVMTYHWKGNRLTYVMSTSNDQYYAYFSDKKWQKWILEKSDARNISDKHVFEITGI